MSDLTDQAREEADRLSGLWWREDFSARNLLLQQADRIEELEAFIRERFPQYTVTEALFLHHNQTDRALGD